MLGPGGPGRLRELLLGPGGSGDESGAWMLGPGRSGRLRELLTWAWPVWRLRVLLCLRKGWRDDED